MQDLEGKVALVTGGASGIGWSIARAFAEIGMKVAIADIDEATGAEAVSQLVASGYAGLNVDLNVTDREGWERAASTVEATLGPIHVLVNNAGIMGPGLSVADTPPSVWDQQIAINLTGMFNGVHTVLPRMQKHQEGGHIVNTSSMSGLTARANNAGYIASKHAIIGFSDGLRHELRDRGIGVSVLCPGPVETRIRETSRAIRVAEVPTPTQEPKDMSGTAAREVGQPAWWCGVVVLDAIRSNSFFVMTHPDHRARALARFDEMMAAFDRAAVLRAAYPDHLPASASAHEV